MPEKDNIKVVAWSGEPSQKPEGNAPIKRELEQNPLLPATIPPWLPLPGFGPGFGIDPPNGISELSPNVGPGHEKEQILLQEVTAVASKVLNEMEEGAGGAAKMAKFGFLLPPDASLFDRLGKKG